MGKSYRDTGVFSWLLTVQTEEHLEPCPCARKQHKRLLHSSLDAHCASTREEVSTNCKAVPALAQMLNHTSFVEQPPLYNWMSFCLFMTCAWVDLHETWFMAKLIGRHTFRQERSEGCWNSPSRSLLLLTAADSFATSDRIIEWGVIWESPHLPAARYIPPIHTGGDGHTRALGVWRIAAVWLWHSSICWWKRCHMNSPQRGGFLHPYSTRAQI